MITITPSLTHGQSGKQGEPSTLDLGAIDFPTSASGDAQREFVTGVLALHSFWYPEARTHFRKARELDPDFAMAYWGEAMTHDHPIWGQHDQKAGDKILTALEDRGSSLKWNEREKMYISAIKKLYQTNSSMDERRRAYAKAMNHLSETFPDDDEAAVFTALANMTIPEYDYHDPDVRDLVPIAAKLEEIYQRNRSHPGAMHYLIHIYDNDKFAEMGLRPARQYADIAYSSSHAIHMPSHIYRQLEMWDQVIESNIAAWEASVAWQQRTERPIQARDYHSYRWLFDAHLENNNYDKACEQIQNLAKLDNQAKNKGEDSGRISSSLERFKEDFKEEVVGGEYSCGGVD